MTPRKVFTFIGLNSALAICLFLLTRRIVSDWFIFVAVGLSIIIIFLSFSMLSDRSRRNQ